MERNLSLGSDSVYSDQHCLDLSTLLLLPLPQLDGISVAEMKELREKAEKYAFEAEVNKMMRLIINSLYRNKEVHLCDCVCVCVCVSVCVCVM